MSSASLLIGALGYGQKVTMCKSYREEVRVIITMLTNYHFFHASEEIPIILGSNNCLLLTSGQPGLTLNFTCKSQ